MTPPSSRRGQGRRGADAAPGRGRRLPIALILATAMAAAVHLGLSSPEPSASASPSVPATLAAAPAPSATASALWTQYVQDPWRHPALPNCSMAGYAYGQAPFPPPSGPVLDVTAFGAVADDDVDDGPAFQAAIAAAEQRGGGTVAAGPGTWRIGGMLAIRGSGVVLRGAGSAQTVLQFARPLSAILGPRAAQWSWRGGLVWIGPMDDDARPDPRPAAVTIAASCAEAATELPVDEAGAAWARTQVGRVLLMTWRADQSLLRRIGATRGFQTWDFSTWSSVVDGRIDWTWSNEIAAVEAGRIRLRKPLRLPIGAEGGVALSTPGLGLTGSAAIGMTLRMPVHERPGHLQDPGYNGIYLSDAYHCLVEDIAVEQADNGIILDRSCNNTIARFAMRGGSAHHGASFRAGSHDNLMQDFTLACALHHGISVQDMASGNVWSRGVMEHGTFDSHRGMPFDNLRTDITVQSDGRPGGSNDAGPFCGRRMVNWNIRVGTGANGKPPKGAAWVASPDMLPHGALVGLQGIGLVKESRPWALPQADHECAIEGTGAVPSPANLYEAQRQLQSR